MHTLDIHNIDYLERLKQEIQMISLLFRSLAYFEKKEKTESISRVLMKLLDHFYYKVNYFL